MTSTPPPPEDQEPTIPIDGGAPWGHANPPPGYGGYPAPPPGYGYPPPGYVYGAGPGAPFGVDPRTGVPYSDKQKVVAGVLQLLVPLGIGRMYMGDVGLGIAQLVVAVVTCGVGALWSFIDGILILTGEYKDSQGRPLRP